jgi:hypothetical protein
MSSEDFYAHCLAAADSEHRLPLSRMTSWNVAPFEQENLRVVPLRPPVVPDLAQADAEVVARALEDSYSPMERWG